jgi:hypothetical protein
MRARNAPFFLQPFVALDRGQFWLMLAELSLDDRIAAAFGDGANSGDVAVLIKETEAASLSCGDAAIGRVARDPSRGRAYRPWPPLRRAACHRL